MSIHEFHLDAIEKTGAIILATAMLSTTRVDLAYLLRRAHEMHVGRPIRLLFNRILQIVSARQTESPASVFFAVRARFLKIARQYSQSGFWKLIDEKGVGSLGIEIVRNLTEHDVIMAAGKQLGVAG